MNDSLLTLRGFGVAFGERIILSSVDLEIPDRQCAVLLGPAGTGKSTLLRTLAGFNNANPSLRTWGEARYADQPLGELNAPALVSQSARLMLCSVFENIVHGLPERHLLTQMQQRELVCRLLHEAGLAHLDDRLDAPVVALPLSLQRHLAIMRSTLCAPPLLCIDEPTSGLDPREALPLLDYIGSLRAHRSLLVVVHNQEHARRIGDSFALLAGGVIQETGEGEDFFLNPRSRAARDFVRSGSCANPAPDTAPEDLDPDTPPQAPTPPAARQYVSDSFGPRGFLWLKKGQLAGTPRPGIFFDLDYDLRALKRVGVTHLVTLTQTAPDTAALNAHAIANSWFPIPDMAAPAVQQAIDACERIDSLLTRGDVVAVHCRAGLGRTGTVLAAYLIWEGRSALTALETARRIEPRWVQSQVQVDFLEQFEQHLATSAVRRDAGPLTPSPLTRHTLTQENHHVPT